MEQSSRIALTAFLHDLGKLAERAGIDHGGRLDGNKQTYCPWRPLAPGSTSGYHSHVHAAYTGIAWDALEATGHFPDLRKDAPPFAPAASENVTDSAINAAAAHHKPDTFLQWVVATADRVASGFERDNFDEYNHANERENHYQARLLTLFEQIGKQTVKEGELAWRYPLKPLSPLSIFPAAQASVTPKNDADAKAEYLALWEALLKGIKDIPRSHVNNLPLWLDHFDSLWLTLTHAIPAATAFGVKPEVALYDHSKAAAALATALWRWHHDGGAESVESLKTREGWGEAKFLMVQGEFFGIQDFIFAEGADTQKHAHKLLRGRSFQVTLLAECAALKLLEAFELPPTSQIINAAGKFMIVAPNTDAVRRKVEACRGELNAWCLTHTYGEIGVGLATVEASCNDFAQGRFGGLVKNLFAALDVAKHQRFDLCADTAPTAFDGYLDRFDNTLDPPQCRINAHHPADKESSGKRGYSISRLADDQIRIGEQLTKGARLLALRDAGTHRQALGLDYFGYRIAFAKDEDRSGKFGQDAKENNLVRCWDFDAPEADGNVWRGYARRFVNAYVPVWNETDQTLISDKKYARLNQDALGDETAPGKIKTLHAIASEDGHDRENRGKYRGEIALVTIKGDIDNLGSLLQTGLEKPTFAKMASLSRQINAFFSLWLPWYCEHGRDATGVGRFRNTYTVFAGGDDFFLIGPWESTLRLAGEMREHFARYVANPAITFSAGMVMTHPKTPLRHLAHEAQEALDHAKAFKQGGVEKNAAHVWGRTLSWADWQMLSEKRLPALEALMVRAGDSHAGFSTGLVYALLQLSDRTESTRPEDAIWASQLHYRLARFFRDRVRGDAGAPARRDALLADSIAEIGGALRTHRGAYRLPLSILLYRQRD